jgi:hypothetical protein
MNHARLKQIQQCVKEAGAVMVSATQGKAHVQVLLANGRRVFTGLTPSDKRANLNLTRDIKREWNATNND